MFRGRAATARPSSFWIEMMKVLAFTPTYRLENGETAMRPETAAAVEGQLFDGEMKWLVGYDNPWPYPTHKNVLHQYQEARRMCLEGGYDALWTIEHDMWPPAGALQRLSDTPAGVVYGVYVLRHGSNVLNAWEYIGDKNLGGSLTIRPVALAAAVERGSARVCGCGWGCTLIRRPVLERIAFTDGGGENPAGDLAFARACLAEGVVSVARFDVLCGHYEDGRWLWPFREVAVKVKVEPLRDVVIPGGVRLVKGQEVEIEAGLVEDLTRAGYVRVVEEEAGPELAVVDGQGSGLEKAVRPRGKKRGGGL